MATTDPDPERVEELIKREESLLVDRLPRSITFQKEASRSLAAGVACSWHELTPATVYGSRGEGATLWDLDGNAYADFHLGYGVMVVGHGNPKVVEAVRARVAEGTHFAMPTEDTVAVAEALQERFGLPLWRFKTTGSEATMDACRIMRASTGRELVIKVEGSYHGSSDGLAFSYYPPEAARAGERPDSVPNTAGVPGVFGEALRVVPYNDLEAVDRVLADEGDRVAGMILEPILLNISAVFPDDGYLAGLKERLHRHGAFLAYDEVKTGCTVAYGGATEWSGVTPDIVALAKAIGGGLPVSAIGGTEEVMASVVDGTMEQEGTFNGNPLGMAAASATLTEVLTRDVYDRFEELNDRLASGLTEVFARRGLPAHVQSIRARGGIQFSASTVRNLADYLRTNENLAHLAQVFQANRGVWEPSSDPWTLSVSHTEEQIDRYVSNVDELAAELLR
jgi:glutamate-1-semialdehyde 2,1-aminomutase